MKYLRLRDVVELNNGKNKKQWYTTTAIAEFRNAIIIGNYAIKSDIDYSLQYIEYIQFQLDALYFTDPIRALLRKTYVVTAVGIIESFFVLLLKTADNWFKKKFYDLKEHEDNMIEEPYSYNNTRRRKKIIIQEEK